MVHIRTLIYLTLLIQLLLVMGMFFGKWKSDLEKFHEKNIEGFVTNNCKIAEIYINKANDKVCSILETIQTALGNKSINTTDRILLNLFFIPIMTKNKYIKKIEVILPNRYEYIVVDTSSGWQTITQLVGEKGVLRKKTLWNDDGMQMLGEVSEEVPSGELLINSDWYKNAISLCLQQPTQNKKGIPKIWVSKPEINENGDSYRSFLAMAVGYEDAPFSAVYMEIDWSWLQYVVTNLFRDLSIYSYIIKDEIVLCKLGMENISNREISQFSSISNLPQEIQEIVLSKDTNFHYSPSRSNNFIIARNLKTFYEYPVLCVFNIPIINIDFSPAGDVEIWIIVLSSICLYLLLTLLLVKILTQPIKKLSEWLESPNISTEKPVFNFKIREFNNLMNKIHAIFYFWKAWVDSYQEDKFSGKLIYEEDGVGKLEIPESEQRKDTFVFSNEGKAGVAIESVQSLYKENIRLQRQIELVNQYYQRMLETRNKKQLKIEGQLITLKEMLKIATKTGTPYLDKIMNIMDVVVQMLSIKGIIIWKVNKDDNIVLPKYFYPDISVNGCSYDHCKHLVEQMMWNECILIRSAEQDYRSHPWENILNARSLVFVPMKKAEESHIEEFLLIFDTEERNWEWNDEVFIIAIAKIISKIEKEDKELK